MCVWVGVCVWVWMSHQLLVRVGGGAGRWMEELCRSKEGKEYTTAGSSASEIRPARHLPGPRALARPSVLQHLQSHRPHQPSQPSGAHNGLQHLAAAAAATLPIPPGLAVSVAPSPPLLGLQAALGLAGCSGGRADARGQLHRQSWSSNHVDADAMWHQACCCLLPPCTTITRNQATHVVGRQVVSSSSQRQGQPCLHGVGGHGAGRLGFALLLAAPRGRRAGSIVGSDQRPGAAVALHRRQQRQLGAGAGRHPGLLGRLRRRGRGAVASRVLACRGAALLGTLLLLLLLLQALQLQQDPLDSAAQPAAAGGAGRGRRRAAVALRLLRLLRLLQPLHGAGHIGRHILAASLSGGWALGAGRRGAKHAAGAAAGAAQEGSQQQLGIRHVALQAVQLALRGVTLGSHRRQLLLQPRPALLQLPLQRRLPLLRLPQLPPERLQLALGLLQLLQGGLLLRGGAAHRSQLLGCLPPQLGCLLPHGGLILLCSLLVRRHLLLCSLHGRGSRRQLLSKLGSVLCRSPQLAFQLCPGSCCLLQLLPQRRLHLLRLLPHSGSQLRCLLHRGPLQPLRLGGRLGLLLLQLHSGLPLRLGRLLRRLFLLPLKLRLRRPQLITHGKHLQAWGADTTSTNGKQGKRCASCCSFHMAKAAAQAGHGQEHGQQQARTSLLEASARRCTSSSSPRRSGSCTQGGRSSSGQHIVGPHGAGMP